MQPSEQTLNIGTILHGSTYTYRIESILGQGSFGITYLASTRIKVQGSLGTLETDMQVAVKEFFLKGMNTREATGVVAESSQGSLAGEYGRKFLKEAENLSHLSHSHIVRVLEVFSANNTHYYVMEYVKGDTLDNYIKEWNGLPEKEALECIRSIGNALTYMHSRKMLHLDLKPKNIMRRNDGYLYLIDFGLSKQYDEKGEPESSTSIGQGTPRYAPLEQGNRLDNKDFAATLDVYALGATLYKALTAQTPPNAYDIFSEGFPLEELTDHKVSSNTITSITKAMEPAKKNRYQSVDEFLMSLAVEEEDTISDAETLKEKVDDGKNRGFYKTITGEAEYGTQEVKKIPVKESMPFPDAGIYISLHKNDNTGISYQIWLNERICNTSYVYLDGKLVVDEDFAGEIPTDVKEHIIVHGFLSTEHWELEPSTTPLGETFGYSVIIEFRYRDKPYFIRKVENAHPHFHALLLNAVEKLVKETSMSSYISFKANNGSVP